MLPSTEQLVQEIHDRPTRIVLAATGGGSRGPDCHATENLGIC